MPVNILAPLPLSGQDFGKGDLEEIFEPSKILWNVKPHLS